jgi:iron-sulfur cluster assembly protein
MFSTDQIMPVTFTTRAISEVKQIMHTKGISPQAYGLRIGIRGSGCSGTSYLLGFDTVNGTDKTYNADGIPVYIDKKHLMYVMGMQIDYETSENESGFVFLNPDAQPAQP